jgi:hypothetical protein
MIEFSSSNRSLRNQKALPIVSVIVEKRLVLTASFAHTFI